MFKTWLQKITSKGIVGEGRVSHISPLHLPMAEFKIGSWYKLVFLVFEFFCKRLVREQNAITLSLAVKKIGSHFLSKPQKADALSGIRVEGDKTFSLGDVHNHREESF